MKTFNKLFFLAVTVCLLSLTSCKNIQPVMVTKVDNPVIKKLDMEGIEMALPITVKNPNAFGFNIYKSKMKITVNGVDLGEAKLDKKVRIGGSSEKMHDLIISADLKNLKKDAIPLLIGLQTKKSATFKIEGNMKVGKLFYKKRFPIDITEKVSLQ